MSDPAVEAAVVVSRAVERAHACEPGELLSLAYLAARSARERWAPGGMPLDAYLRWRVRGALADAIRDGALTGRSARRRAQVVVSSSSAELATFTDREPGRLEAREEAERVLRRVRPGDRHCLVAVAALGWTQTEAARAFGVAQSGVSQRLARALREARAV